MIFFTDADCRLGPETLARAAASLAVLGPRAALGGTYAVEPADPGFFSRFKAVFVHEAETRGAAADYLATHAFAIRAAEYRESGGFAERLGLPILEDVEYSHRLRRAGWRLAIDPEVQVRHPGRAVDRSRGMKGREDLPHLLIGKQSPAKAS